MYLYYAIAYEKWVHLEWLKTLNLHNLKEEVEWVSVLAGKKCFIRILAFKYPHMKNLDEVENLRAFYDCIGTLKNCSVTHQLPKMWFLVKVIRNSSNFLEALAWNYLGIM